ncbi:MAG TPA: 6-carboxytetrahydropterin synthase [Usitatibacter sp.]|jgi:6-pyruvoyltetrahydropterin/6-carboxytetrahydropterin synthase|nr:6-carboxytetrahydropterin synthase [Usitatibacter sp.]
MELALRFGFDAAHRFDVFPEGHPNRSLHGHSFQVEVAIAGEPDPATGMIADLGDVEAECKRVRNLLDHRVLNDIPGLGQPSLENLCLFVWRALEAPLPQLARVTVRRESIGQSCTYTGR